MSLSCFGALPPSLYRLEGTTVPSSLVWVSQCILSSCSSLRFRLTSQPRDGDVHPDPIIQGIYRNLMNMCCNLPNTTAPWTGIHPESKSFLRKTPHFSQLSGWWEMGKDFATFPENNISNLIHIYVLHLHPSFSLHSHAPFGNVTQLHRQKMSLNLIEPHRI